MIKENTGVNAKGYLVVFIEYSGFFNGRSLMHIFKGFPHVSVNLRLTAGKVIERKSVGVRVRVRVRVNSKYVYKIVKYFF